MWRGLVPGAERRGGQGLPAPMLANLIPHVPDPRPVRGADPGAGTGATMVSCAVTVFTVCWWWWWWWQWWWCRGVILGRAGEAGQGRAAPMWAGLRPLKTLTSRLPDPLRGQGSGNSYS